MIKIKGKNSNQSERYTKANGLIGPVANSFVGNIDGMKKVKCPVKNDKEVFNDLTPDMSSAPDGSTSGWGSIVSYSIDEIQGKSESYVSAVTATAQKNDLPKFYFKYNNDNIYKITSQKLIQILKNE